MTEHAGGVALSTPRLLLRPHRATDFADCSAMWGDPAVVRFIGNGQPLTGEEVWARMLRYAGCWELCGYGYWAVRERAGGQFLGDVGFQNLRRSTEPALPDEPEIGWVLAAEAQGRGYAREAITAVLAWADAHLPSGTMCIIQPDHRRSVRIAGEVGYRPTGSALLRKRPIDVFRRPRAFHIAPAVTTS